MSKNFTPFLFIGVGNTNAFFTLREADETLQGTPTSFHIRNLSQDPDEAFEKAVAFSIDYGMPLATTREQLQEQLREIHRLPPGEAEALRIALEAQKFNDACDMEYEFIVACMKTIESGIVPVGSFKGERLENITKGYVTWLVDNYEEFEVGGPVRLLADWAIKNALHKVLPKADPEATVGSPGERIDLDVIVTKVVTFPIYNYNGQPDIGCITTMVTSEGVCVVCKSNRFMVDDGEELKIKATVKDHVKYKDQMQTVVQRVKVIQINSEE